MLAKPVRETDLYEPVKQLLEQQGYEVKAEVGAADVVARRGDEAPVIVELKTGFSLALSHQAIDRLKLADSVYVAVPRGSGRAFQKSLKNNLTLCRRLGIGLMTVRLKDGLVEGHADPGPYAPRKQVRKQARLLKEFARLNSDPNTGGQTRKGGPVTAYRQDALRCAAVLSAGPVKAAEVAKLARVERARAIMADNHYGWFERVERGVYGLTVAGLEAVWQDG